MKPNADMPETAGATPQDAVGRTFGGLLWAGFGTGGHAVVQLAALIVLARLVTPAEFGLVAAALVVVGISAIFSHLGIGPALVQRPELLPSHIGTGFTISIGLGIACGALIWLSAPWLADFFGRAELTPILRVLALVFPMQGLTVVAEALLQREMQFRTLAWVELTSVCVGYGGIGIFMAFQGSGAWALVGAHLGQNATNAGLLLWLQPHVKRLGVDRTALRELMFFGGGFTVARISNYLAGQGDSLVVGRWLGMAALGIYGRAYQLMVAPASILGQILDRVLFPTMARVQDQPDKLAFAYRRGVALIALVALPGSAALIVLAPEIVEVLLGAIWADVVLPLRILAIGMLFRMSYKMSDSLARATGAVYRRAWRQAAYAFLVIGAALVGQAWGVTGVAAGVVAAVAVNFLLMAQLSLRLTGLSWRSFLDAHIPGVALAGLVGLEVVAIAETLRAWELPAWGVLLSIVFILPSTLFVVLRLPRLFLGEDGHWLLRSVAGLRRSADMKPVELRTPT